MHSFIQNATILLIDNDVHILDMTRSALMSAGYQVIEASDGQSGLRAFYDHVPSLVILDAELPKINGLEVCSRMRMASDLPIILVSDRGGDDDVIDGYERGATYYIVKPVLVRDLLARVKIALERRKTSVRRTSQFYGDAYLTVDLASREVYVKGEPIILSRTEFSLLALLIQHHNRTLNYHQILGHVWHDGTNLSARRVHTVIWRLRKKIEVDPTQPVYLVGEYGIGYRFESSTV